jgi:hypothetical protein
MRILRSLSASKKTDYELGENMESLGEALPKEQARVRELILQYRDPMLGGAGVFAATMMENSLREADQAVMSGDVVAMLRAYEDLKGYNA